MQHHLGAVYLGLIVACLIGWTAAGGMGDDGPPVRPEHPRLLVTPEELPQLCAQAAAYPQEWERLKGSALWPPSDPGYGDARAIRNAALAYLITREEPYLRSAVALAQHIAREHKLDQYASPEAVFGLALAYDWCHSGLTTEQREEIAQAILRLTEYLDTHIWRHSDFNNHFALEKVWPFVFAGLALHGDIADARAADYLTRGEDLLKRHLLPAANLMAGTTGGQFEGYGYDNWGYMRPLSWVLEAWRTGTGEDLFPECSAGRNHARWNIYARRPHDGMLEHFDDAGLGHRWSPSPEGEYIYLLAARYRDGHAQWMGDQIERRYDSLLWPIILWRDPGLAPSPPDDLPLTRHFDAIGWVLMRSSWTPDATFASFQSGPFLCGHQHLDNNAFTIHKGGLLAIDPGINAYGERISDGYRANYYSRSVAHNTVTVYDPDETFPQGSWGSGPPGAANDGGQMRHRALERVEEAERSDDWRVGKLIAYADHDLFTYAVGDATRSYTPRKLERFWRHFLYLRPDVFVILDQVVAKNPSFRKTWLLHSVNEPLVQGRRVTLTNGEARLVSLTLLPEQAAITAIGGPGKECWVEGRNWPSQEKDEWPPEAGSWRVEVSPAATAADELFLHVIQVGGDEIATPGAVEMARTGDAVDLRVRAQGREYAISFHPGQVTCHLRVEEAGRVLLDQELR